MAQDSPRGGARVELSIPVRRGKNASADYFVLGHDSRLAQVVTNLIDNACSFSEPGGVVRVALERTSRKEPDAKHASNHVVITVDDDGPGVPPHALERIFERFYRGDASHSSDVVGSGLGLSICREIALAHGGNIWLDRREPGWTAFILALPCL